MKKLFAVLVLVGMLFLTVPCFAQGDTHAQVIYTEVIESTTAAVTAIPVTKIRPNVDKIVGMQVYVLGPSFGTAALYDCASTSLVASTEVIAEYEATSTYPAGLFFPFPRSITAGVVVSQDARTRVIIYYVRQ